MIFPAWLRCDALNQSEWIRPYVEKNCRGRFSEGDEEKTRFDSVGCEKNQTKTAERGSRRSDDRRRNAHAERTS